MRALLLAALALVLLAAPARAEDKKLPADLKAEIALHAAQERIAVLEVENEKLRRLLAAYDGAVSQMIGERASDRAKELNASWEALARRAVAALGGDYDKGDRYDPAREGLVRAAPEKKEDKK